MRIDVHNHFNLIDYAKQREGAKELPSARHQNNMWWMNCCSGLTIPFTPQLTNWEKKIQDMDADGIDVAVMSYGMPGPERLPANEAEEFAKLAHDELAKHIAAHPNRFWGFATLGFGNMDGSMKELDRAINDLGFKGLQLYANIAGRTLDDPELRPFFARLHEYDLPVFIHPTVPLNRVGMEDFHIMAAVGFLFDTTVAALRIIHAGIFDEFPGIKIILPHVGSVIPYLKGRIDNISRVPGSKTKIDGLVSQAFANYYVDTVTYHQEAMDLCYKVVGADRILYGSDYPYAPYKISLKVLDDLDCTAEERDKMNYKNAETLLKVSVPKQG